MEVYFTALPPTLQARLDEAGVTNEEELHALLDTDPALKQAMDAHLQGMAERAYQQALQLFLTVEDSQALAALVQRAPFMLDESFIERASHLAQRHEERGDLDAAQAIRERIAGLRQLQQDPAPSHSPLRQALLAFLNTHPPDELRALLVAHPALLTEAVEPLFETLARHYRGDTQATRLLQAKRALLDDCRTKGIEPTLTTLAASYERADEVSRFQKALDHFLARLEQAATELTIERAEAAVQAGAALRAPEFADLPGVDQAALRGMLAQSHTRLGMAYGQAGQAEAALAEHEQALALEPDNAAWHRNRAATLIALRRPAEAKATLERATTLEPASPRLATLRAQLAKMEK